MNEWASEIQQIERPYHSTTALGDFLDRHGCFVDGTEVLDVGAGIGAALHHFKSLRPGVNFLGTDYNLEKVQRGQQLAAELGVSGIGFETADWFNMPASYTGRFDGVISIHAMCCLKHIEDAVLPLIGMKPRWIAINSLFYEGSLDVLIHIRNHERPELADDNPDGDFNIFSLDRLRDLAGEHGYQLAFERFHPSEDIPAPANGRRGTYTMKTAIHERTQFSGPVHLPWYFVLLQRGT